MFTEPDDVIIIIMTHVFVVDYFGHEVTRYVLHLRTSLQCDLYLSRTRLWHAFAQSCPHAGMGCLTRLQ